MRGWKIQARKLIRLVSKSAAVSKFARMVEEEVAFREGASSFPRGFDGPEGNTRFADYTHYSGTTESAGDREVAPVFPLYTDAQMAAAVTELRAMLSQDSSPECRQALRSDFAEAIRSFAGAWFQRIDYPRHGIASTSDPSLAYIDEGGFNRLAQRLTSLEACLLRPWPKWHYIRPLLPPVQDKTVLEIGSSNGFFSFRFAELGARQVTGVEIVRRTHESSLWSRDVLGLRNVRFLHTDFLLDLSLPAHDVVFLSEVHNHFLFPFYGLLRLVNLARETLILDTVSSDTPRHGIELSSGWHHASGRIIYHSFELTSGMILDFLSLIGIRPARVTRYCAPDESRHNLYRIDTRGVDAERVARAYPEFLQSVIDLKFRT